MESKKINQLATEMSPAASDLTIIGDPTTGVSKKVTLEQISSLFAGAVSFYTNYASFPVTGVVDTIYCAKDTQKLYLWSGSTYVEVFPSQALLNTYQLKSEKGNANGYASLDSGGKVPISQLPSSIMEYKGTWSAATNTPTLSNGTGDTGDVYICNAAGSVNFGAGSITFAVGDYVIYSGSIWQRSSGAVGTVTSVALSSSTSGVTIGSSPITTSGTITLDINTASGSQNGLLSSTDWSTFNNKQAALSFTAPLVNTSNTISIPVATSLVDGYLDNLDWTNFNTAYNNMIVSAAVTGTTTKTLTLTQQDAGTITASWTDDNTDAVTSVFGRTGAVVAQSGDYNTSQVTENTNLYFTDARSRAALSFTAGSGAYNSTTGVITIPTNNNQITNGSNFITLTSLSAGTGISYNNTTGVITNSAPDQTVSLTAGAGISISGTYPSFTIASTITQYTDALARAAISLTTTGTSGAATYNSTTGVFNIPNYAPDLSGYVPTSRTITINGTSFDLSANRTYSVGTVTSVGLSSATSGVTIGSTPITTSGTITLAIATASGSQNGLLSSTDWTTFNNKQSALTNPVTGTGTTNTLPKFTGASTIGNSNITDTGSLITLGSNTTISSGALGIGTTTLTGYNLNVTKNITGGSVSYGIVSTGAVQSDVTTSANYFLSQSSTAAATYTTASIFQFRATQATFGAGSTVTNQIGFQVDASLIGATNNYAFRSQIAAATGRWNLYMDGTANNYLAGSLGIGTTTLTAKLDVRSSATSGSTASPTFRAFGQDTDSYFEVNNNSSNSADIKLTRSDATLMFSVNGHTGLGYLFGQLGIGNVSPNASAKVQIDSTTQGVLLPRMTAAQRTAIATPAEGLIVVQTDGTQGLYLYIGAAWHAITML